MHRVGSGKSMFLFLVLLYFTAVLAVQLTGISNAGDVCSNEKLQATPNLQTIFSPNFPRNYPNNVNCTTHITSPEKTVIELIFDTFDLEDSENCFKDSLSIIGGNDDVLLFPKCGSYIFWPNYPEEIVSTSNNVAITFVTDDQINNKGFNATFRAVQPFQRYLILALNSSIGVVNRFNELEFHVTPVGIMDPLAVDYDPLTQYVYYTDRGAKAIGRIHLELPSLETVLHSNNISEPFGLRIDINSRLLYWTDAELGTISVSNLEGKYRNTLIDTELDKPGAIVTEPLKGYIYFTDWGTNPKIERADGDGSNRLILVNSHLVSPHSLAIDLKERKLYWFNANHSTLESVNYDGTNRTSLGTLSFVSVVSLVLDDDAFILSGFIADDPADGAIFIFSRKKHSQMVDGLRLETGESYYKGITLRPRHKSDVPDICRMVDCKGLCLPKPNNQYTCLPEDEPDIPPVSLPFWPWIVLGLLGLGAVIFIGVVVYRRRRRYGRRTNYQTVEGI